MAEACRVLAVPRSRMYARRTCDARGGESRTGNLYIGAQRALRQEERQGILEVLNSERFVDCAPREVYATLLEDGQYVAHWRTMYRILAEHGQIRERRDQTRRPVYAKPQLLALQPNAVWSWDITRLLLQVRWAYLYLYVMLDLFSRFAVGWMIAEEETAVQGQHFIATTCARHGITPGQLTIHADRGAPMKAKTTAQLFADLGIAESHSRPRVSDDNPFSEAQFKTLKYAPGYPKQFESRAHAQDWAQGLFDWYNYRHHHTALALFTPADMFFGQVEHKLAIRQAALDAAFAAHPARFGYRCPVAQRPPDHAAINWPKLEVIPPLESTVNSSSQLLLTC